MIFCLGDKKWGMIKLLFYVGLDCSNYYRWIKNNVQYEILFYMVIKKFKVWLIILNWLDYMKCYDALNRNLIVNRGYELKVYNILVVIENFLSVSLRYIMVWMLVETRFIKYCLQLYIVYDCTKDKNGWLYMTKNLRDKVSWMKIFDLGTMEGVSIVIRPWLCTLICDELLHSRQDLECDSIFMSMCVFASVGESLVVD